MLFVGLTVFGLVRRHRQGKACDRAFTSKLAWQAASLATAVVGSIVPSVWVVLSFTWSGGSIESNMPPGYTPAFILGSLTVGGAFILISTFFGYMEHVDS